jgi:hypothetical protein
MHADDQSALTMLQRLCCLRLGPGTVHPVPELAHPAASFVWLGGQVSNLRPIGYRRRGNPIVFSESFARRYRLQSCQALFGSRWTRGLQLSSRFFRHFSHRRRATTLDDLQAGSSAQICHLRIDS